METIYKPCPFCGSRDIQIVELIMGDGPGGAHVIRCNSCPCTLDTVLYTEEEIKDGVDDWNHRVAETGMKIDIIDLVNENKEQKKRITELEKSALVWHKYPDEKPPTDGRYLFWDSDGNAPHVLPYNDIVVRDNPYVFSTQTHWAGIPSTPEEQ
jgi:hypothetical protein